MVRRTEIGKKSLEKTKKNVYNGSLTRKKQRSGQFNFIDFVCASLTSSVAGDLLQI